MSDQPVRVVLVDDHALMLDGLRHLLNREPDVQVVASTQNAVTLCEILDGGGIDVVLLDIEMPYHGFRALKDIQRRHYPVRVLLLTGFATDDNLRQAIAAGADGLVFKREAFAHLAEAIQQVAAGRLVFPAEATPLLNNSLDDTDSELSPRENDVLSQVARGLTNSEIARKLNISTNTVSFHLKNIFCKLNVNNRTEATVWYFTNRSSFS
jgi:DNA-binding NarL/FixJ family response regulator